MPPPPPPSKSYLLNIIDSSDEEAEEQDDDDAYSRPNQQLHMQEFLRQQQQQQQQQQQTHEQTHEQERIRHRNDHETFPEPVKRIDTPETMHTEDDDDDDDDESDTAALEQAPEPSITISLPNNNNNKKKKKRKKKKKKKKPKKPNAASSETTTSTETEPSIGNAATSPSFSPPRRRSIHFGSVTLRHYPRCLGTMVVPLDGGWPLGITIQQQQYTSDVDESEDELGDASSSLPSYTCSVDEFEERKQAFLRERWNKVVLPTLATTTDDTTAQSTASVTPSTPSKQQQQQQSTTATPPSPDDYLETRQWDYKPSGHKNPLFMLVKEQERMALLLEEVDGIDQILEQRILQLQEAKKNKQKKQSSSPKQQHKYQTRARSRSGSWGNNENNSKNSPSSSSRRSRNSRSSSTGFGKEERYNDIFTEYTVHHVRNELETIRTQRTQEDARGCTCRKLSVYIPPPGAGKKAAHRRMNVKKVKEELQKRQLLPQDHMKKTREELELLLLETVQQEPCCRPDNHCPCVANGIGCQSDVCKCWYAAHQAKSASNNTKQLPVVEITPAVIQERCRNVHGMYSTDMDRIAAHRAKFLCQPVGTPLSSNPSMIM